MARRRSANSRRVGSSKSRSSTSSISSRSQPRTQQRRARKSPSELSRARSLFARTRPRDSRGRFLPMNFRFALFEQILSHCGSIVH